MQDLLPTEVNIKHLRLIYCKDLAWTGFASEHERVPCRHQCPLTCMVHKISSWTRFRSDNLLDGWQQRASQRVTTWEDHSPHARNVQHSDSEDRVMPLASFQKEAKGVASPVPPPEGEASKAARQTLHSRNGSSPRAKRDMLHGRRIRFPNSVHCTHPEPLRG